MRSTLRIGRLSVLGLLSMVGLLAAMFTAIPAQAAPPTSSCSAPPCYSGRAYAVGTFGLISPTLLGNVPPITTTAGDTGPLPATGGTVEFAPGPVVINGVIVATVATETASGSVVGGVPESTATSTLASVAFGTALVATVLTASTDVDCDEGLVSQSSALTSLTIGGTPVTPPSTTATTVVTVANAAGLTIATVVFNRHSYDPATNKASTDAVVVNFPSTGVLASVIQGTIVLSHAESDLDCKLSPSPSPSPAPPPTSAPTPVPTPAPTASGPVPSLPSTGSGPRQVSAPFGGTSGLLTIVVLLLLSASTASTGLVLWRRRSHLTS